MWFVLVQAVQVVQLAETRRIQVTVREPGIIRAVAVRAIDGHGLVAFPAGVQEGVDPLPNHLLSTGHFEKAPASPDYS